MSYSAAAEALARRFLDAFHGRLIVRSRKRLGRGALLLVRLVLRSGGIGRRGVVLGLLGDHGFLLVRVDVPRAVHFKTSINALGG